MILNKNQFLLNILVNDGTQYAVIIAMLAGVAWFLYSYIDKEEKREKAKGKISITPKTRNHERNT
jgi:hypothetical protein